MLRRGWLRPEEVPAGRATIDETTTWLSRATWAFVALGLAVRLVRYLVVYPIWHDEAFVAVNFLDRDYLDLLRPLDYAQVSPILFLWIELFFSRLLGFSEWSLRLFPAICGLASVLLFRRLAARLLRGVPLLLAVGIFATSFYPIRHGAEVKPYASDLLAALVLLALAVEWWHRPARSRCLWVLTAVAPILLALSYPAVFVAAGVSLALGPTVLRVAGRPVRLAYLVYNVVVLASFVSIFFSSTAVQSGAVRSFYRWGYWRASFPPWEEPWKIPGWLIGVHTGNTLAYPIGGERGASTATLIALFVGIAVMWRRGRTVPLGLLLAPFATGLAAASLGQYPYGGAPRITQYLVPSICLLTGLGAAVLLARVRPAARRRRALGAAVGLLAAIAIWLIGRDLMQPYRVWQDVETREFARRFWNADGREADLLCVRSDLGLTWQPKLWTSGMSAVYLVHRAMFAHPRLRNNVAFRAGPLAGQRPARLVFFDELPRDNPCFDQWLARIHSSYKVGPSQDFTVFPGKPGELWLRDRYIVLDLTPKEPLEDRSARSLKPYQVVR